MRGWLVLAALAGLAGCFAEQIEEVAPRIRWAIEDRTPTAAYVPGTEMEVIVEWAARCRTEGPGDTSTTETCDDQDFRATVRCEGAPCDLLPPATEAGVELDGSGRVGLRATGPGDLTVEIALEHLGTGEQLVERRMLVIRELERVVVDCIYQAYDPAMPRCVDRGSYIECQDRPWQACGASAAADPVWGTPISIWIYGEGGGFPISAWTEIPGLERPLLPWVRFGELVPDPTEYVQSTGHADERAGYGALRFEAKPKTAGTLSIRAGVGDFTADRVMQLQ